MYYRVSITCRANRDESCNLYNLTWHFDVDEVMLTPATLADMINAVKDRFLGSWPQRNINRPSKAIIPVDVEVAPIEEILQLQEAPRGEGEAA
jgi:hypothetical protein